uniref:LysR substrate-binding domain-containing protein n=1 Tax=Leucobacter celer TaxID=668625 RepID=UPI0006A79BC1
MSKRIAVLERGLGVALAAALDGSIDPAFRGLIASGARLPDALRAERVIDDRHQLLVGPRHPLADAASVALAELCAYPVWMPGMREDTEWGAYYAALSEAFGIRIDAEDPGFGSEVLLDELAESAELATFVGEGSRYLWPESYDLRRIPVVDPRPVYPHSIIWRADNEHPALLGFLEHLREVRAGEAEVWSWAPS